VSDSALILVWTETSGGRQRTFRRFRASPEAATQIQEDVAKAAQLHVPSILPPLETRVTAEGEVTIVSAAAHGRTLRDLLQAMVMSEEKLKVSYATWIIIELLKSLEQAHAQGVFHGRLSPEHIMLTPKAEVLLSGFGLDTAARHLINRESPMVAALAYVSPEQALGDPASAKSDVFAVGSILFEVLTNEPLFIEATFGATFDAIENDAVPRLLDIRQELPKALDAAAGWALEKNAERRCPEASALRRRLEAFQGILDAGDHTKPGEHQKSIAELLRKKEKPSVDAAFDTSNADNPFEDNALYAPTRVVPKAHPRKKAPAAAAAKRGSIAGTLLRVTAMFLLGAAGVATWAAWPRLEGPLRQRLPPALASRLGLAPLPVVEPLVPAVAAVPVAAAVEVDAGLAELSAPDASTAVAEAPAEPPAAPLPALLKIDSVPPSDVLLDSKPLGHTPLARVEVEPGQHTLEFVSKKPKLKQTQKLTVTEGETLDVQVKLKRKP
jgi:hypothetical protein